MKVVSLIKHVPDTKDQRFSDKNKIVREGVDFIVNPSDEYAIEEGVSLKEKFQCDVTALSMGPSSVIELLRFAVSVGINQGVLVSDEALSGTDLLGTSRVLSAAVKKIGDVDLLLCGQKSSDGENGVVPSALAEFLGYGCVVDVRKIVELKDGKAIVEQVVPGGHLEWEVTLPAVIAVVKEINEPRLPSLKGKMNAKKAEIQTWALSDLGLSAEEVGQAGARTKVIEISKPDKRNEVNIISGDTADELSNNLVQELLDKKLI